MTRNAKAGAGVFVAFFAAMLVGSIGVALVIGGDGSTAMASSGRLPDLDQEAPTDLGIRATMVDGKPRYALGFRSAVRNIGDGPMIIDGSRPDTGTSTMTMDQLIDRAGTSQRRVRAVGKVRYVVSPDHRHWHYLKFDRYELRSAETGKAVVKDRKSGFCLGDRYAVPRALPAASPQKVYTSRCGLSQPELLTMREGISVGYGDDYAAYLEGQDLPLNGLRSGRYLLVHTANADHKLQELSYANNAASVLLELTWSRGAPTIRVLASCTETDRCS